MKKRQVLTAFILACTATSVGQAQRPIPVERGFSLSEPILLDSSVMESAPPAAADGMPTDAETARYLKDAEDVDAKVLPVAGQAEMVTQRFENGKPQVERWVVLAESGNYVNHGAYKRYAASGDLVSHGEYVMGQRQGEWFQTIDQRQAQGLASNIDRGFVAPFMSKATFQSDILTGDWTLVDAKGQTVFVWNFIDGQRSGHSSWYNSKGDIVQSIPYEQNLANGIAVIGSQADSKAREVEYRHGLVLDVVEEFYTNNHNERIVKSREEFLVPMSTSIVGHDWANNKVSLDRRPDVQPVKHGRSVHYHSDGQKLSEGSYEQGRETGVFVWWYANGQRRVIGQFDNGNEVGPWHFWHSNGMKKTVGHFVDGAPTGQWQTWDEQGKLVKRQNGEEVQLSTANLMASGQLPTRK